MRSRGVAVAVADQRAHEGDRLLRLLGRRGLARCRSPRSARRRSRRRQLVRRSTCGQVDLHLLAQLALRLAGLALLLRLADAQDRHAARPRAPRAPSAASAASVSPKCWRRSEWPSTTRAHAELEQHRRRDLAGEGARVLPRACSARRRARRRPERPLDDRAQRGERRADRRRPTPRRQVDAPAGSVAGTPPPPRSSCASSSSPRSAAGACCSTFG